MGDDSNQTVDRGAVLIHFFVAPDALLNVAASALHWKPETIPKRTWFNSRARTLTRIRHTTVHNEVQFATDFY